MTTFRVYVFAHRGLGDMLMLATADSADELRRKVVAAFPLADYSVSIKPWKGKRGTLRAMAVVR
jgi:hypothetical protein